MSGIWKRANCTVAVLGVAAVVFLTHPGASIAEPGDPADKDSTARQVLTFLAADKIDAAKALMAPELQGSQFDAPLESIHKILDHDGTGSFQGLRQTGSFFYTPITGPTQKYTTLSYEARFKDSWVLADVIFSGDTGKVTRINTKPIAASTIAENRLTFVGKPLHYYVVAAIAIAILAVILSTLVVIVRSPIRRRWLWCVVSIFGIPQFSLNWTTGGIGINPLSLQLFGVGLAQQAPYLPFILTFGLPVGAIVFWIRRKRLIANRLMALSVRPLSNATVG